LRNWDLAEDKMRIAAFNVENLFDRAKAFNEDDTAVAQNIFRLVGEFNAMIEEETYTPEHKTRFIEIMKELGILSDDEGPFVRLRKIRGRFIKRSRLGFKKEITAKGRNSWVGWLELKTAPVLETAILNTGRVIKDVDADILAVIEAEDRISLSQFSSHVLKKIDGTPYEQVMLIDGNDRRGIDVGLMTKNNYKIKSVESHIFDKSPAGHTIFSRDCPVYQVIAPDNQVVWVLPNHFKSKYGGDDPISQARRKAQAVRVADIYSEIRALDDNAMVVVLGDLNDTPDSEPLRPLFATDLVDVGELGVFDTGDWPGKGTYGLGNDTDKIDYVLLSPNLQSKVTGAGLFRKGAWPGSRPPRWPIYDTIEDKVDVASDHHVIYVDLDLSISA